MNYRTIAVLNKKPEDLPQLEFKPGKDDLDTLVYAEFFFMDQRFGLVKHDHQLNPGIDLLADMQEKHIPIGMLLERIGVTLDDVTWKLTSEMMADEIIQRVASKKGITTEQLIEELTNEKEDINEK